MDEARADYRLVRQYMIRSADKMPDADYSFTPAPGVRTFAQQIAHVADDQYNLCAPVRGETRNARYREIELTLKTKADLVPALKKAFDYCDPAYDSVTAKNAAEVVPFGNTTRTKLSMLSGVNYFSRRVASRENVTEFLDVVGLSWRGAPARAGGDSRPAFVLDS